MNRPVPTTLFHFTDESHLPQIVSDGLLADTAVGDRLTREAGLPSIKQLRRARAVPLWPGGVVGDYVPFYFAPQSPMMFVISRGQVPAYGHDISRLVYLTTSIERLLDYGYHPLFTRRNASLVNADFTADVGVLDGHIDWQIMREQYWRDTPEDGDRKARRMAECLIHERVGWEAFEYLGVYDAAALRRTESLLRTRGVARSVGVHRDWYY